MADRLIFSFCSPIAQSKKKFDRLQIKIGRQMALIVLFKMLEMVFFFHKKMIFRFHKYIHNGRFVLFSFFIIVHNIENTDSSEQKSSYHHVNFYFNHKTTRIIKCPLFIEFEYKIAYSASTFKSRQYFLSSRCLNLF